MKIEKSRHPLATLRLMIRRSVNEKIGMTQKQMADLLEVSLPTIQSIESGRLDLSERLALKAQSETGISAVWLMGEDTKNPVNTTGEPFTQEDFDFWRSENEMPHGENPNDVYFACLNLATHVTWVAAMLARAYGTPKYRVCMHKLATAGVELKREFGLDSRITALFGRASSGSAPNLQVISNAFLKVVKSKTKSKK